MSGIINKEEDNYGSSDSEYMSSCEESDIVSACNDLDLNDSEPFTLDDDLAGGYSCSNMLIDTHEDTWTRVRDINVKGDILEYCGPGVQIQHNAIAQSNIRLSPTNHYFEIEIVNPGECCYIAIGVARKNYPFEKHPGWQIGSVAFHADDGKLFTGHGFGSKFGPKCAAGDLLGCGIVFPLNFSDLLQEEKRCLSEWELVRHVRERDRSPNWRGARQPGLAPYEQVLEVWNINDDSDDEVHWINENEMGDTKVKVFFRHNQKLLGIREVRVPREGFYPIIGMMSKGEKVRVDFAPLSG